MGICGKALAAAATLGLAQIGIGAITLDFPDAQVAPGSTFTIDAVFSGVPTGGTQSVGYQVAVMITGPDTKLHLTGATALDGPYGAPGDFVFFPKGDEFPTVDVYAFGELFLSPGAFATIRDEDVFATFTGTVDAGASGPYQIGWYLVDDPMKSELLDGTGDFIPGVAFTGGTISVPEPACMAATGIASLWLIRRRRV